MPINRAEIKAFFKEFEYNTVKAYLEILDLTAARADINEMIEAIKAYDPDALFMASGIKNGMWSILIEELRRSFWISGNYVAERTVPGRFQFVFDMTQPRVENFLRLRSSNLITGNLMPEIRGAIREILESGMRRGDNPRTIALDIVGRRSTFTYKRKGGVLGLTEQQAKWVSNMTDDLANLNPRYFKRRLRDRRYDKMVRRSFDEGKPLPIKLRRQLVTMYKSRMQKYRGDTIARTEALRSINESTNEVMRQIVDDGLAPKEAITRIWRHSMQPNERPGHKQMHGWKRGVGEVFTNPETDYDLEYPGDGPASESINCRCYIEPKVDFIAVAKARVA